MARKVWGYVSQLTSSRGAEGARFFDIFRVHKPSGRKQFVGQKMEGKYYLRAKGSHQGYYEAYDGSGQYFFPNMPALSWAATKRVIRRGDRNQRVYWPSKPKWGEK